MWRALHERLASESLIYLGDGLNCPYGGRSREEIRGYSESAVERLLSRGCKLIVVACNTASAMSVGYLREKYADIPFVALEPAVKPACLTTESGVVGVLATKRCLEGEMYLNTSSQYRDRVKILESVGEGFVEAVENDEEDAPATERLVRNVLEPMLDAGADRIVLGCTHYPFLLPLMRRIASGRGVEFLDSGEAVVRRTIDRLEKFGLAASPDHEPSYVFETFADEEYRRHLERKAFGR